LKEEHPVARADQVGGVCGAASLDLVARRLASDRYVGVSDALEHEVPTLGALADGLRALGLACRFEEHLRAEGLPLLPRDACVVFVLPPREAGGTAHLLVGLRDARGDLAIVDPVGPFPDRALTMDSATFAGWTGSALVVTRAESVVPPPLTIALVCASSIVLFALGWKLGCRSGTR
jgi:hypothetical protein